jgi:RNA polymerase sigma-70 factor (ECF subfamily)
LAPPDIEPASDPVFDAGTGPDILPAGRVAAGRRGTGVTTDVALAIAGDARAFERLYRTHVDRIFGLCVRMTGDRVAAEELTQDVFVRAWEKLRLFRGDSAFGTWLHRLAVNVVLSARAAARRHGNRETTDDGEIAALVAQPSGPPGERGDVATAIARLPPGARHIFVLHDIEGYRHDEIGEMLGITAGGSKAQLHRARYLLREALTR